MFDLAVRVGKYLLKKLSSSRFGDRVFAIVICRLIQFRKRANLEILQNYHIFCMFALFDEKVPFRSFQIWWIHSLISSIMKSNRPHQKYPHFHFCFIFVLVLLTPRQVKLAHAKVVVFCPKSSNDRHCMWDSDDPVFCGPKFRYIHQAWLALAFTCNIWLYLLSFSLRDLFLFHLFSISQRQTQKEY